MNLIERVKNILVTPKTEWEVINTETATIGSLFTGYVLPLAILSSLGTVLKFLMFGGGFAFWGMQYIIISAIIAFVSMLIAFYVSAMIVDMLAPSFGSEKNLGKSAQLVAYSSTASYVGGLLSFIPILGWIIAIAAWVYGIYIMYLGIGPIKKTPEDKKVVYMVVAFIIMVALYLIVAAILGAILFAAMGRTIIGATTGV